MAYLSTSPAPAIRVAAAIFATPAVLVFLSSNVVNVGNLAFNMIFSRLLGPETFGVLAMLLTIKLALLGVMGAVQMAVSQMVASSQNGERPAIGQALSRINRILFLGVLFLGVSLTTGLALVGPVGARLLPTEPHLLALLLLALPFGAAASVLRGVAFGEMRTGRIILSANMEMGVRLAGALIAWGLGLGLEGVVLAISLSVFASWVVLSDVLPRADAKINFRPVAQTLAVASIPFAILQITQVIALDGDIFLANALLSEIDAGYTAALSLFQRIQFFACFALAGVLLPRVVQVAREGGDVLRCALPVYALFAVVGLTVTFAALIAPGILITLLAGEAYLPAAAALIPAVVSAAMFTFSYLTTTLLIAFKDRLGIVLIASGALLQCAIIVWAEPADFSDLVGVKAVLQGGIAILVALRAAHLMRRLSNTPCPAPSD